MGIVTGETQTTRSRFFVVVVFDASRQALETHNNVPANGLYLLELRPFL